MTVTPRNYSDLPSGPLVRGEGVRVRGFVSTLAALPDRHSFQHLVNDLVHKGLVERCVAEEQAEERRLTSLWLSIVPTSVMA